MPTPHTLSPFEVRRQVEDRDTPDTQAGVVLTELKTLYKPTDYVKLNIPVRVCVATFHCPALHHSLSHPTQPQVRLQRCVRPPAPLFPCEGREHCVMSLLATLQVCLARA